MDAASTSLERSAERFAPVFVSGRAALDALDDEWNGGADRARNASPFLRGHWHRAWWDAFGSGEPVSIRVRDPLGALAGSAFFVTERRRMRVAPARVLALATNVHSNRAGIAVRGPGVAKAIADAAESMRPTAIVLDHVAVDDEAIVEMHDVLVSRGWRPVVTPREQPPVISLEHGAEGAFAKLSGKWKRNLRNREKRIVSAGPLTHEVVTAYTPDLGARLDQCFALEAAAWKGSEGSAVDSSPDTRAFYRRIAREASLDGTLALHMLRSDGHLAAFQLDLVHGGVEYVLKIGYEPALAQFSPGALLLWRVIERAGARRLRAVDLLGDDMPWKRDWTDDVRRHVRITLFAPTIRGRALHAVESRMVPALRSLRDRLH